MSPVRVAIVLAGVLCLSHALPALSLGSFIRNPANAIDSVANLAVNGAKGGLNKVVSGVNKVVGGTIGAQQNLINTGTALISNTAKSATDGVSKAAGVGSSLLAPVPVLGQLASTGSIILQAGSSTANAGIQSGLYVVSSLENAKLNAIKGVVDTVAGLTQGVGGTVLDGSKVVVNTGVGVAHIVADILDGWADKRPSQLSSVVSSLAPLAVSAASGLVSQLPAAVSGVAPQVAEATLEVASQLPAAASNVLPQATSAASELVSQLPVAASKLVPQAASAASDLLSQLPEVASNVVPQASSAASDLLSKLPETASNVLPQAASAASDLLSQLPETASNVVPQASSAASDFLSKLPETAFNVLPQAVSAASEIVSQLPVAGSKLTIF